MTIPQGDVRLLDHDVARELLASTELARVAFVALDGTPRIFPINFSWTGDELVFGTYGGFKISALRERPTVAVTIDTPGPPPHVLQLRGEVTLEQVDGAPPEYIDAQARYYGEAQAASVRATVEQDGTRMFRVGLRPTWVGVLDFTTRLPEVIAGG